MDLGDNLTDNAGPVDQKFLNHPNQPKPARLKGMKTVKIMLEESTDIPPTGLFLAVNGQAYMLRPAVPVRVPLQLIEVLDNAITTTPVMDPQTQRIIGYRSRRRFSYRLMNDTPEAEAA